MLRELQLNFFPTALNNFKWSADGQLCIPVRDTVYVLTSPALNPLDISPAPVSNADKELYRSRKPEEHLKEAALGEDNAVKPNEQFHYSAIELGNNVPEVADIFRVKDFALSIANKPQHVAALEWSPLGVGTYKRCVLAILTTCFKIYIYEPISLLGKGWRLLSALSTQIQALLGDKALARGQCREMSWSTPCPLKARRWGQSILAISTHANEIVLFEVHNIKAKIILRHQIGEKVTDYLGGVKNLCWSPWAAINESKGQAWLTFSVGYKLCVQKVIMEYIGTETRCFVEKSPITVACALTRAHTPLHALWYGKAVKTPKTSGKSESGYILAVALQKNVCIFTVDANANDFVNVAPVQKTEVELVDTITGFAFSIGVDKDSLVLNIATIGGTMVKMDLVPHSPNSRHLQRYETYCLERKSRRKLTPEGVLSDEDWDRETGSNRKRLKLSSVARSKGEAQLQLDDFDDDDDYFNVDDDTADEIDWISLVNTKRNEQILEMEISDATSKVYGMTVSPFSGIIAVMYRRKPQGYAEYIINEAEEIFISFELPTSWCHALNAAIEVVADKDVASSFFSTEAFVADLQNCLWHSDGSEMYDFLEETFSEFNETAELDTAVMQYATSSEIQESFACRLFMGQGLSILRLHCALEPFKNKTVSLKEETSLALEPTILKLLTSSILHIPYEASTSACTPSKLSKVVTYMHCLVGVVSFYNDEEIFALARARIEEIKQVSGNAMQEESIILHSRERWKDKREFYSGLHMVTGNTYEFCSWCKFPIHFKDLQSAECSSGHRFRRCSLTFLALQCSTSRACGICAREYLPESLILEDEIAAKDVGSDKPTLARILYDTIDVCLFCGGHLYDKSERYGSGPAVH